MLKGHACPEALSSPRFRTLATDGVDQLALTECDDITRQSHFRAHDDRNSRAFRNRSSVLVNHGHSCPLGSDCSFGRYLCRRVRT